VSERRPLAQAGLPQGSPLSPILFLFFNADLVQHKINKNGGAMAFVDDYTAWVVGPSATANRARIQKIIDRALEWERRSGATFEGSKTVVQHFTRDGKRTDASPFIIKGQEVVPREEVRILGVTMDSQLRYRSHIVNAATKGLRAAMALKRLRSLSPSTARQLFGATVAPIVDYASNVWTHACRAGDKASLNRVQRTGAQAVTGVFQTVATAVGEAEASLRTTAERHAEKALKLWINMHTLPETHPLARPRPNLFQRFVSPIQRMAKNWQHVGTERMEVIQAYTIAPWEQRMTTVILQDREEAAEAAKNAWGLTIATSTSVRNEIVGIGGTIRDTQGKTPEEEIVRQAVIVGPRTEQNPYSAELHAIAWTLKRLPRVDKKPITILSSNQAALQALHQPRQQSGQAIIRQIYEAMWQENARGNFVIGAWVPPQGFKQGQTAKKKARKATEDGRKVVRPYPQTKATTISVAKRDLQKHRAIPPGVGKYSKGIDAALPGNHTRRLYDGLNRTESTILARLRTGMTKLNGYLYQIGAAESDQCECGAAKETIQHFLFRCTRWTTQRALLLQQTESRRGDLSFFLGGKAASDPADWRPNMTAVRATIQYTIATGRFAEDLE
jgi:hypothetical protein